MFWIEKEETRTLIYIWLSLMQDYDCESMKGL
jgi:hypothetical protein